MATNRSTQAPLNGAATLSKRLNVLSHSFAYDSANARLCSEAAQRIEALEGALKDLVGLGENVPIFQLDGGRASVKAVRLAGKFVAAMDKARALSRGRS